MLKSIPSTKIRNKAEEAPFGIPGDITEPKNNVRDKQIVESEIGFMLNSTGTTVTNCSSTVTNQS